jgi:hypothetical protein
MARLEALMGETDALMLDLALLRHRATAPKRLRRMVLRRFFLGER